MQRVKESGIVRAWIVEVEEDVHSALFCEVANLCLSGTRFVPMRIGGPIAVMVVWDSVFSSVAGCYVVHVHDGHNEDFRILPKPDGFGGVGEDPFGESLSDPAGTGFPSMLACMGPYAEAFLVGLGALADGEHWDGPAFA